MIRPITPSEVLERKAQEIPSEVIEAFNELIAKNFDGTEAVVAQSEVVLLICEKLDWTKTKEEVIKKNLLDVEFVFEQAGWKVVYDKPGYNECREAHFRFTKKSDRPLPHR